MEGQSPLTRPRALAAIVRDTHRSGFTMASEPEVGAFLRALAASKPGGRLLELGTGTGHGTAWLLEGMDGAARLDSVDTDAAVQEIARRHVGHDPRVTFHLEDGADFLRGCRPEEYDLIFADAWPGKFFHLDLTLSLVRKGGIYFVDDLLPQPNWPEGHEEKVAALVRGLESRSGFAAARLEWGSGVMILVRSD